MATIGVVFNVAIEPKKKMMAQCHHLHLFKHKEEGDDINCH